MFHSPMVSDATTTTFPSLRQKNASNANAPAKPKVANRLLNLKKSFFEFLAKSRKAHNFDTVRSLLSIELGIYNDSTF